MRQFLVIALCALISTSAFAKGQWPSLEDFQRYSHRQMRQLPQVRVPLGKRVRAEKLSGKSYVELLLMKNSIFAQTGTTFKSPALDSYFRQFSFYGHSKTKLKDIDRKNVSLIVAALKTANKGAQPIDGEDGYDNYGGYGEEGYGEDGYGYGYGGER